MIPLRPQLRRHVLPWDRPLPAQAAAWLAQNWTEGPLDLSRALVVVPTRQAGRRLREALAEHAAERGTAVLSPRVVLPEDLLVPDPERGGPAVASRLETQLAWVEVLRGIDLEEFRAVFPLDPPARNFAWASRLALQFSRLQAALGENGLRLGDVLRRAGEDLPETERWRQLAELERACDRVLLGRDRLQLQAAGIRIADQPELPADIARVVVMAAPDPLPLAVRVLEQWAKQLPVEIVIHGPAEGLGLFDAWGRPDVEVWRRRPLALDFAHQVRLCADASEQADLVAALARGYGKVEGRLAVGVADAEVTPVLEHRLRQEGIASFNPAGRVRRGDGLYALLAALAEFIREPAFDIVQRLVRCPDFMAWLAQGGDFPPAEMLSELDALQERHLPATVEAALGHVTSRPLARRALQAAAELREQLRAGDFPENAAAAIGRLFAGRRVQEDSSLAGSAAAWMEVLREAAEARQVAPELTPAEWWELALGQFGEKVRFEPRPAAAMDLLGWLELLWEDAPHLVVTGLNDGRVPEAVAGDPFLPEALRVRLGLKTNEARFARDAYLLAALAAARSREGGLDILVGKVSAVGDPIRPSRLLLQCDDRELPARVDALFREADAPRNAPAWRRAWQLTPPVLPPPARISVTAFKHYLRCPFRFYLKYVLKMETVDPFKSELDAFDFGTLCHAALEAMGSDAAMRDCTDEEVLRQFLLTHLDRRARELYGSELTLPLLVQLESARQRLGRLAQVQAAQRAEGWVIERVEHPILLPVGGIAVSGKIDRIERQLRTGATRVIDYKTSDQGVSPLEAHVRPARKEETAPEWARFTMGGKELVWIDLQLPLYLEALAGEFGGQVGAGYCNLPKAVGETQLALWENYTAEWRSAARRCMEEVATRVAAGVFWPPAEIPPREDDDAFAGLFHQGTAASVAWGGAR